MTDAEGDTITIGMPSCLPASCPFGFTNGNVQRVDYCFCRIMTLPFDQSKRNIE